jgi:simple sugar transport system permease protein
VTEDRTRGLEVAAIALLISLACGSLFMLMTGHAPGHVWVTMIERVFGSRYEVGQMLYKATGLLLAGLSVAIALDAGLFNIGAEGQMTAGVLACACTGAALPDGTPAIVAIPLCVLAAAAGGAAVGALIGVMRVTRGAHEVITSIMLNAIVIGVSLYVGNALLFQSGTTRGPAIAAGAELPRLPLAGSAANVSLVVALAVAGGMWWLRTFTTWGVAWRAVGEAPEAARSAGLPVAKIRVLVLAGSGALAGLVAINLVMGHKYAFEEGLGRGTGFLGIAAAMLGRRHPAGVAAAALLLGFLSSGGLAVNDIVPKEITEILQGIVVLAVATTSAWARRREVAA